MAIATGMIIRIGIGKQKIITFVVNPKIPFADRITEKSQKDFSRQDQTQGYTLVHEI